MGVQEMHKIEFYQIEKEVVPTMLRLMVDGSIQVSYRSLDDTFGYHFEINKPMSQGLADSIIKDIADTMQRQSYDHGAEWMVTDIKHEVDKLFDMEFHNYDVFFRIKDIY